MHVLNMVRRRAVRVCTVRSRRARQVMEAGMTTAEYAVGTVAACAFGALLYKVVTSGPVEAALTGLVERALSVPF